MTASTFLTNDRFGAVRAACESSSAHEMATNNVVMSTRIT